MALLNCGIASGALGQCTSFMAVIPEGVKDDIPTMYLLHGLSDDYTGWTRYTAIERYACERGLAVIMPGAGRSFYEDMVYGPAYFTHIAEEIVHEARRLFRLSEKREKNFVAGLSMGGYGALKIAMRKPEIFSAAGSISGVTDIVNRTMRSEWDNDMRLIFGDNYKSTVKGSDADLFALADKMKVRPDAPRLIQICGTEDFLYEDNIKFRDYAKSAGLDLTYEEHPGNHNWYFWDKQIRTVMDFFCGNYNAG